LKTIGALIWAPARRIIQWKVRASGRDLISRLLCELVVMMNLG
jgi:hypothetical protein